jgi:hypothetical protein
LLIPILDEAYKIEYDEKPNYGKLRFFLELVLLENGSIPDKNYSWLDPEFL